MVSPLIAVFVIVDVVHFSALKVFYLMLICPNLLFSGHTGIDNDDWLII
jgi:hypothetical protein